MIKKEHIEDSSRSGQSTGHSHPALDQSTSHGHPHHPSQVRATGHPVAESDDSLGPGLNQNYMVHIDGIVDS